MVSSHRKIFPHDVESKTLIDNNISCVVLCSLEQLVQYSIVMVLSEPEQPFHKRKTLFTVGALRFGEVKGLAQVTQSPSDRGCI